MTMLYDIVCQLTLVKKRNTIVKSQLINLISSMQSTDIQAHCLAAEFSLK